MNSNQRQAREGPPTDPVTALFRFGADGPGLSEALAVAKATNRRVALLHADVDMFHLVNSNMGEEVGDLLLATIAQRLHDILPRESQLWRLSGDDFLISVSYLDDEPDGTALAEALRNAFEAPLWIPPYTLSVTLSIGIAVFPDHATDAAALLSCAERALRNAKRDGNNNIGLHNEARGNEQPDGGFAERFIDALDNRELCLHFQPLVDGLSGSLTGFSALLRWNTARQGLLRPRQFLDSVERAGLSARLDVWALETTIRQLAQWRDRGIDYLSLSLHVSNALLSQPNFVHMVGEQLHRYNLRGTSLEFEISESALTFSAQRVHSNLAGLRTLGAVLTVQDFGLGGLSFAALAQYPLNRLKIGRDFIRNVDSDPRSAAIVRGIIAMGHRLGMKITGKGVESEAELGFLRRNHCDFFLGHLFSPPLPADRLDDLITRRFFLPKAFAATTPERTLLLLDDEENMLRSLVRLFRRDGYRILTASSVREAFDLLASNPVHVIVSDQRMPDMNGTEFLAKVRDLYPDTIRMVLSGYTDLATVTDAINRGAIYRFITKPWNDDELRGHIQAAFRTHERRAAGESAY